MCDKNVLECAYDSNMSVRKNSTDSRNRSRLYLDYLNVSRTLCTQAYFLRCSFDTKLDFLNKLGAKIGNINALFRLLNTLYTMFGKLSAYAKSAEQNNFFYDKLIRDHNRALNKLELDENILDELDWFSNLPDSEQIYFILSLLRMSGGGIVRIFYEKLWKNCNKNKKIVNTPTVQELKEKTGKTTAVKQPIPDLLEQEVLKQQKRWTEAICKYRKELEDKPGKKGKKGSAEEMDWIQLLPIWVVKKIFAQLDPKTLKNASKVNKYWAYVIKDLAQEKKIRKLMDKNQKILDGDLDDDLSLEAINLETSFQKKMRRANERCAARKELVSTENAVLTEQSLLLTAINEMVDAYLLPVAQLTAYKRPITNDDLLYKRCTLNARDLNYFDEDRINAKAKASTVFDCSENSDSASYNESNKLYD